MYRHRHNTCTVGSELVGPWHKHTRDATRTHIAVHDTQTHLSTYTNAHTRTHLCTYTHIPTCVLRLNRPRQVKEGIDSAGRHNIGHVTKPKRNLCHYLPSQFNIPTSCCPWFPLGGCLLNVVNFAVDWWVFLLFFFTDAINDSQLGEYIPFRVLLFPQLDSKYFDQPITE